MLVGSEDKTGEAFYNRQRRHSALGYRAQSSTKGSLMNLKYVSTFSGKGQGQVPHNCILLGLILVAAKGCNLYCTDGCSTDSRRLCSPPRRCPRSNKNWTRLFPMCHRSTRHSRRVRRWCTSTPRCSTTNWPQRPARTWRLLATRG
jgi:hypothetical protein